jgi:D-alanine--poly(phosphoribitol) ligase subunit 1
MKFCFTQKDFIEEDVVPNKLAVVGEDEKLSWSKFKHRVDDLCEFFRKENLAELANPVLVYGHKNANMLVAFYAMMKLEIPYIPIDVIYPKQRIESIVTSSDSQLVLNTTSEKLQLESLSEIQLNKGQFKRTNSSETKLRTSKTNDPLVYILYTSGSTGEPKGVQISTEAIHSFTRWMTSDDFKFSASDVFINSAILSFDLSVFEVMTFGAVGGTLLLNNKTVTSDTVLLLNRVEEYKGSVWVSTPSFAFLYSRMSNCTQLNSVHTFLFCGEVLPNSIAKGLRKNFPKAKVLNTYGPTEATVATTIVDITDEIIEASESLPVGFSKMESQLLIQEDGEIVIVGPNVSLGYVKNPELNKEKFITIEGKRAFKTGDFGYLENGMLFFNGRNDDLVKLHGYRIELNEITTAINKLPYVLQGETIGLKRGGAVKKIVSLVQLQNQNEEINPSQIKTDLEKTIPHYMVPSDVKFVKSIPLNQNGKADKKLLTEMYMKR